MANCGYAVVTERGPRRYGAHVTDLPGCVAVGETKAQVGALIRETIELDVDVQEEDGRPLPTPLPWELTRTRYTIDRERESL